MNFERTVDNRSKRSRAAATLTHPPTPERLCDTSPAPAVSQRPSPHHDVPGSEASPVQDSPRKARLSSSGSSDGDAEGDSPPVPPKAKAKKRKGPSITTAPGRKRSKVNAEASVHAETAPEPGKRQSARKPRPPPHKGQLPFASGHAKLDSK